MCNVDAEQMKGICQSEGGLRMELSPIRLHTRPNSVATFTCAYQAHLPLNITFHMLGLAATRTRVVQSMARVRREEEGVEEMFPWSGSRQWRVEVDGGAECRRLLLGRPQQPHLGQAARPRHH